MAENIIVAAFEPGSHATRTRRIWQYNYGMILQLEGIDLPEVFEAHFSNTDECGISITQIGTDGAVTIPDEFLLTGEPIYCWIFLHESPDDGETVYKITIPVKRRAEPTDIEPTPVQQDAITQAIAALNSAVTQTGQDAESAAGSASDAADSAEEAKASKEAAETAEGHAAEAARTAQGYAEDAVGYAGQASESASEAALSAQVSGGSAAVAAGYAGEAQAARTDAQAAAMTAQAAQGLAETARAAAENAQTGAETARSGAETAKTGAQAAQSGAETARTGAETARDAAQNAQTAAETAQRLAETARGGAEAAQSAAQTAAGNAAASAQTASNAAEECETLAGDLAREATQADIKTATDELLTLVQQIAETGGSAGSLNGYSLAPGETDEILISYTDEETEESATITAVTDTTGTAIAAALMETANIWKEAIEDA